MGCSTVSCFCVFLGHQATVVGELPKEEFLNLVESFGYLRSAEVDPYTVRFQRNGASFQVGMSYYRSEPNALVYVGSSSMRVEFDMPRMFPRERLAAWA